MSDVFSRPWFGNLLLSLITLGIGAQTAILWSQAQALASLQSAALAQERLNESFDQRIMDNTRDLTDVKVSVARLEK